ncbi:MAG: zf-HC2 domain-containing protein [Deltaproteobacteria bacterium]|nr:zf-HC2 domain-containing protein [Candidatus Zymogenaceae bacterium]
MKTKHRKFEKLLSAYLFGELDEKEAERLESHLARCEDCARALRREKQLHRTLSGALAHRTIDPEFDITDLVLGKIREIEGRKSIADRISNMFDMRLRHAAAYALAASIGLAAGVLPLFTFLTPSVATPEPQTDPLAVEYLMDAPPQSLTAFYFDREVTDE